MRSTSKVDRGERSARLPGNDPTSSIHRQGNRQIVDIPDEQHACSGGNGCFVIQKQVACGIVFQMDRTTFTGETIFRSKRERREVPTLDCGVCLRLDFDGKSNIFPLAELLRNPTDFKCNSI